jgi:hypothetical protein
MPHFLHIELNRSGSKRILLDEHTMNACANSICPIFIGDNSHTSLEMGVGMVLTWVPCSFKDGCDYVVYRRLGWIPCPFSHNRHRSDERRARRSLIFADPPPGPTSFGRRLHGIEHLQCIFAFDAVAPERRFAVIPDGIAVNDFEHSSRRRLLTPPDRRETPLRP